jgi:DNA-binding SARP family transcriptional activator
MSPYGPRETCLSPAANPRLNALFGGLSECYERYVVEFRILGPLEVVRDGQRVDVGGKRQRGVLTMLLLEANRLVPADVLRDRLWGEEPPPSAATSLHNAVSQLRKLLGDGVIETRAPGYVLHVEPGAFDLARFEQRLHDARTSPPEARAAILASALAEWRGPALAESAYEPWAEAEVRRLEELRTAALEDRLDADLAEGRHVEVVAELESLVRQNPLRERLWGQLMLALYQAGRQGDAALAYQEARTTLVRELGIEPSPALRRIHGAIIRQELEPGADGSAELVAGPGDLTEISSAVLAGRVVPVLGEDTDPLGALLAERFRYPTSEPTDVARISQYAATIQGYGPLHEELREWVRTAAEPTDMHRFLARLPELLRNRGSPHQLLVTTSYGSALEQAFADAGEEVDVVAYLPSGPDRGKFDHLSPDGTSRVIDVPNLYAQELSLERRTIILRLRGRLDGPGGASRSFVVTEDDHIEYLRRADVAAAVPVSLAATLRRSHFLFLGYTVRDWPLRLVLGRIWGDEAVAYRSWAVHPQTSPAERELWRRLDVELLETPLDRFVRALIEAVGAAEAVV